MSFRRCTTDASDDVVQVADPDVSATAEQSVVVPSLKVTVPEGEPEPVTVAVNVTGCPTFDGFCEGVTFTVAPAAVTLKA